MDANTDAFESALDAERARNADQIALFRFVAVSAVFAVNFAFSLLRPDYIGPPLIPFALYALVAGMLWAMRRRYALRARWGALAIPFLDMPMTLILIAAVIERLRQTAYFVDAASVATQLPLFYLLLILLASLTLDVRQTWLAAGLAMVLQSALLLREDRDPSFIAIVVVATALGTSLALYARRRNVALVRSAALEQTRRERLGRYFSPDVANALADSESEIGGGETRDVTVLFADIRDFTRLTDQLPGHQVVAVLNEFHSCMVDKVFANGGTLDKYLGDGLMAYFGAPVEQPDHAERAVRCALEMQAALAELNRSLQRRRLPELRMGVGIHTGSVILGDIGAERRREYTAIGDTVNVASRIEQLTKTCDASILVSKETKDRIAADFAFTPVEPIHVRGKAQPLQTFRVE